MNEELGYTFKESASIFLIFHDTIRLQHFSVWSRECFCLPGWWRFSFSNRWFTFTNPLGRISNETANWPDGTSLKKYRCQEYYFSSRSVADKNMKTKKWDQKSKYVMKSQIWIQISKNNKWNRTNKVKNLKNVDQKLKIEYRKTGSWSDRRDRSRGSQKF